MTQRFYHLVFENPPCPEGARFVELEDDGHFELLLPRANAG
jgi:hypothetical protein